LLSSDLYGTRAWKSTEFCEVYIFHKETDQIFELPVHLFCCYATDIASCRK
jgi:hypothetical protein